MKNACDLPEETMSRRKFILALGAAPLLPFSTRAFAQSARSRTMHIIVPFAPGGSGDITGRLIGQYLGDKTAQKIVIENKPGANGIIGVEAAKNAPADGNTLLLATTSTHAANPSLYRKLPYDPEKDFTIVGVFGSGGSYVLVKPDAPYKSFTDFIAYAKAHPGALNYGHFNASSNVPGALLNNVAEIELTPVPYKQIGTATTDLMAGQIQVAFVDSAAGDAYVTSGQLRALAITRRDRWAKHPDLPTVAEFYPGFEVTGFLGLAVPAGTPRDAMLSLNGLINDAITSEPMRSKMEGFGFTPKRMGLDECDAFVRSERAKWARYVVMAKIEPQ
jgi:tripartite-type tricarboxylate transporter receptor subunit TctC